MAKTIITAAAVITMDPARPRVRAVALEDNRIIAVGSVADCQRICPDADVTDLGRTVLMPGFVESHSHPLLSGMATEAPAYYIAPWVAPTWDDVVAIFKRALTERPADAGLVFFGFDKLLHGVDAPTKDVLDPIFGDRLAAVLDNSGHAAYVTTAVLAELGWIDNPPADPPGAYFGRNPDGSLNGIATEVAAEFAMIAPVQAKLGGSPLHQAMAFMATMSRVGITATSEMTYAADYQAGYEALAAMPGCPLRVSLYHMSTDATAGDELQLKADPDMLRKQGVKLWADGSPWIGNIASSYPYLDTPAVRRAGIPLDTGGEKAMNYTRAQLDAILDEHAPQGWQMSFHVNGDVGLDIVLDAYERALVKHNLLGTDHRWRVEHVGAGRGDQFERAASLGVVASLAPFQFYYWGDLLDGQLFPTEIGANWQRFKAAFDAGLHPSFHNDGSVSPPNPLLNVQTAVTRRTSSGTVRGPRNAVSLDQALAAETINAAHILKRDHEIGSIEVGKFADFVELSADPYTVAAERLASDVKVLGTWLAGRRVDLDGFLGVGASHNGDDHKHLAGRSDPC